MSAKRRGRTKGFVMSHEHRLKIQKGNILNALIEHVSGKRDMSATQVTAGIALLKKVLPDLQSIEHTGDPDNPIETVTRIELTAPNGYSSDTAATEADPRIHRLS